jgi:hypothetical protein
LIPELWSVGGDHDSLGMPFCFKRKFRENDEP